MNKTITCLGVYFKREKFFNLWHEQQQFENKRRNRLKVDSNQKAVATAEAICLMKYNSFMVLHFLRYVSKFYGINFTPYLLSKCRQGIMYDAGELVRLHININTLFVQHDRFPDENGGQ